MVNVGTIGLVGYAQAGKDSVASVLTTDYGYRRVAFADKLKAMAIDINPLLDTNQGLTRLTRLVDLLRWEEAKKHKDCREFLQNLGVAARNHLGKDIWVQAALVDIPLEDNIVITDVRFNNEIAAVHAAGGAVIRVDRPGVGPVNGHVSESEWNSVVPDYIIKNDGSLKDLEKRVKEMLSSLKVLL